MPIAINYKRIEVDRGEVLPRTGYSLPFKGKVRISQGYNGPHTHFAMTDESDIDKPDCRIFDDSYSLDFAAPLGTEVRAARNGIVYLIWDRSDAFFEGADFEEGKKFLPLTNVAVIKHDDGTYTCYSHLAERSSRVRRRDEVYTGQIIAVTGKSGWIGPDPHLHFEAFEKEDRFARKSFPTVFSDYDGPLDDSVIRSLR